jgi:hypothetical protein
MPIEFPPHIFCKLFKLHGFLGKCKHRSRWNGTADFNFSSNDVATATMAGLESGLRFSKTIKMVLTKEDGALKRSATRKIRPV